jgi:hypothetical protein
LQAPHTQAKEKRRRRKKAKLALFHFSIIILRYGK